MNESENRVMAIFVEAMEIADTNAREAFLSKACGADHLLREEVEELLQAEAESGRFLPEQPSGPVADPLGINSPGLPLTPRAEHIGDRIGRYRVLQKIGEGGCGVVYMAEQEQPVHRKVALKVIKLGMDTRNVVARFEAERQALALMDHPNIAKVLDAGAAENGRPYFVMELVRGHKITQYCDEQRFSTRQRLDLFIQVCHAVQHAHQKGVIHRDLKPSNILVTERDGVPVTKVIDFGIAKATCDLHLTDKTLFTAFEQFIGTPAYMSPEQARLGELDIDTRSDIYSLGVLLYELLTGQPPFDAAHLRRLAMDEVLKTIRETDPPLPSSRFTTMTEEQRTTVAHSRQVEPSMLTKLVRGDLDWIAMKALEKHRTRRYETARDLAMDVQRHLNNEPVVARPPNKIYRLQKLMSRNRLAVGAATVIVAVLVVGVAASTEYAFKAKRAQKLATAEATRNQKIVEFLLNILGTGTKMFAGADRQLIVHTATQLDKGELTMADTMFREVLALQKKRFGEKSLPVAQTLNNLAFLQEDRAELEEAETTRYEALAMMRELNCTNCNDMIQALHDLAELVNKRGDVHRAERLHREAIGISVTNRMQFVSAELEIVIYRGGLYASYGLLKDAITDLERAVQLAPRQYLSYYLLAPLLVKTGDTVGYQLQSLAMLGRFFDTADPVVAGDTARTCLLVAETFNAIPANQLADVALKLANTNHPDLAYFEMDKALAEYRLGHFQQAVAWSKKSVERGAAWAAEYNSSREVVTYAVEAMAQQKLKQPVEARASLAKAVAIMERDAPKRSGRAGGTLLVDWLTCEILLREAKTEMAKLDPAL